MLNLRAGIAKAMLAAVCLLMCLPCTGCKKDNPALRLDQLTRGERLYLERIVTLERAKAVLLDQRAVGQALLDSLATAWGDSARAEILAGVPTDPVRAQRLNNLLGRILAAEGDSLLLDPSPRRLLAPLPDVK